MMIRNIILYCCIGLGMLLASCTNDMKNLQELSIRKKYPQGEAFDFKLVYTDSTKVVAVLSSVLNMDFTNQQMPYSEFPEGVKLEFYDANRHKNTVEAKYGIIYPTADMVELRDSVVLTTYDGKQLRSPQLFWDQKEDWIFTDREFTFTDHQKGTVTKGIGMDFDKQFSTVKAHKTTGVLAVEEK
ncbi:LPS export ABC transporter periplasmic protein LptC [Capnocytophaga sp. oral taxon 878]|uniref:LPS export ABC transporter periplasmic protein LptC n=1 Tax=Capnocytophaga sp. oral taxon 878 TaxID=1316596 RepID=UPI000D0379F3|nr:LPS export ABC transporter periplasmic protein LptC [Capnocytophaga sp. oral taxon 878]AVM50689.1 LPS export ABC transporter periplasmic protein LptC [Capnocytophaga sp. oral taxon 878]